LQRDGKNEAMKHDDCTSDAVQEREPVPTPADTRPGRAMRVPVVTQNMPKSDVRIAPAGRDGSPTQQQIEQDVLATNPSVESMESRG